MNEEIKQKFCREFGSDRVLLEEPMKRHTTFRIGGPAEVFVIPGNLEEVQRILEICRQKISRILFLEMEAIFLSVTEDTGGL